MNPLTQIALAGTAKVATDPGASGSPLDELVAALPQAERERALLLRAAAEATYTLAGYVAAPGVPLPAPAPSERQSIGTPAIAALIGDMLAAKQPELLLEALGLLAAADLRLAPALLPSALQVKPADQRAALRPVLGERGRWLSRFNAEWSWATEAVIEAGEIIPANAETLWQEGSHAQRLAILRRVRAEDAALARSWIDAAWREDKADVRNDMLEVLASAPSPDDEPLLERALDDRAPTVRARAASLLAVIPDSGLAQRMRERAEALARYTPPAPAGRLRALVRSVLPGSGELGKLTITLPTALDKAWQRDGIVLKPPHGIGQQSWWLTQTLALVPPSHWEACWKVPPATLIAAAAADDAGLAVIEGWSRAAMLHKTPDWALALWNFWAKAKSRELPYMHARGELLGSLVATLPRQEARTLALQALRDKDLAGEISARMLQALPRPWDAAFGNTYLDAIRVPSDQTGYAHYKTLAVAAHALPPACFERALKQLTPADEQAVDWYFRPFLTMIEQRRRIYEEIKP